MATVSIVAGVASLHGYYLSLKDKELLINSESLPTPLGAGVEEINLIKDELIKASPFHFSGGEDIQLKSNISNSLIESRNNDLVDVLERLSYAKTTFPFPLKGRGAEHISKLKNNIKPSDLKTESVVSDVHYHVQELIKETEKVSKSASSIVDIIRGKGGSNNFTGLFSGIIEKWNNLLHSLTLEQLAIFSNTIVAFLVLTCLINIILIMYSDFLINFFKLEENLPKLAKFIQLRRKLQRFYITLFFSISIIALITVIYLNLKFFYLL